MRDPIRVQLRVISGINHDARGGVVHRQMCPEFLPDTIGRLRPEDLFVIELNALDLFEKTLAESSDHGDIWFASRSLKTSIGLRQFNVLRGLPFSCAATLSSSA